MQQVDTQFWLCGTRARWQSCPAVPLLPMRGAHAWLCRLALGDHLLQHTTPAENARAAQMLPENRAREFLLARGWLRHILSLYVPTAEPRSIELKMTAQGKPFAADFPELQFNLSHSGIYVAVAVSRQPVGIDIEHERPLPDWQAVAESLWNQDTVQKILELPEGERQREFLCRFTAREAHLKALGVGLSAAVPETCTHAQLLALPEIPGYVGSVCMLVGH